MNEDLLNRLPLGTVSFDKIRENQQIYVDKTALVHLIAARKEEFFLARPRRFGKSVLLNTFDVLFRKGLADFHGLAIEKRWQDKTYPVVHLDFSGLKEFISRDCFQSEFENHIKAGFRSVGFTFDEALDLNFNEQFRLWLASLPTSSLVVLIDEYDAPLTAHLNDEVTFRNVRNVMSKFFSALKSNEGCLRFFFMTGITKFRNTSIFSELNHITDLTYDAEFAELLGWTRNELQDYFSPYIENAARVLNTTVDDIYNKLTSYYDGYTFEVSCRRHVYAPWSVLKFLRHPELGFQNYWFASSGEPTVLQQYLLSHDLTSPEYYAEPKAVALSMLDASQDYSSMRRETLLTQTGYLTLKSVARNGMCLLGYPNEEVAQSMAQLYADLLIGKTPLVVVKMAELPEKLATAQLDDIVPYFNNAFSKISYQNYPIRDEATCAMCLQILLIGAAMLPTVEVQNAYGRSDLEVTIGKRRWVFELKFLKAEESNQAKTGVALLAKGLQQILDRHYGEGDLSGRKLCRAALVFSEKERTFTHWQLLSE